MKIITVLGTRPEIIRLSRIIPKLDQVCEHILVHTGQNYTHSLSDVFFEEMGVRQPDYFLGCAAATFGAQIGQILAKTEEIFINEKPNKLLLLGDTNSSLCAPIAKRMGIPVYHMEAGNRCFDDRVPEEVNRRIIDHSSDILLPYTENSRRNLIEEGIDLNRIYVTGNPIYEVLSHYSNKINDSNILKQLNLQAKKYFLVTMHRQENVDSDIPLSILLESFCEISNKYNYPIVVSTHPRTKNRLNQLAHKSKDDLNIQFLEPFGFMDFIALEKNAFCVLTDSGTVQEECSIMQIPNVTIRDTTERPETLECGSNIISGVNTASIVEAVNAALCLSNNWQAPIEYLRENVSDTVIRILFSKPPVKFKWI
jgi:UDP-N-acetylglucosamine 2-epimerase (non-hydrolysing)